MKIMFLALLAMLVSSSALADSLLDMQMQRDILVWHVAQGATPDRACAVIADYFPGAECRAVDGNFFISRGAGVEITYFAAITLAEPERTP
jgi:hypothetical protein